MSENQNIIILGMHRSGTSLVAGILFRFGIFMGKNFLGIHASNPFGHFEDQNVIDLNDQILAAAGGSWKDPPGSEAILNQADKFRKEIISLIAAMPSGTWGWKDPRLSITIELFLPYLHNPVFIVCQREPLLIVDSLYRRSQIDRKQGLRLTDIYQKRIEYVLEKYPDHRRMFVSHKEICSDPGAVIRQIITFLRLEIPPKKYRAARRFVMPKFRVHIAGEIIQKSVSTKAALLNILKIIKSVFSQT